MIKTERTAQTRKDPSFPTKMFEPHFEENNVRTVLDYGCGKGRDVEALVKWGYNAVGYDPNFRPEKPEGKFDAVMLNYVLCVLPERRQRQLVLKNAISHLHRDGLLGIAVRPARNIKAEAKKGKWKTHKDGWLTGAGTFQRGYESYEILEMLNKYAPFDIIDIWWESWSLCLLVCVGTKRVKKS